MKKIARVALVGAVLSGGLFVTAAPASATCHPEKPSTCEAEFPTLEDILARCANAIDTGLPETGVCD